MNILETLNSVAYILGLVLSAIIGSYLTHILKERRQKPKWSTSGISGSFDKREDGTISKITVSLAISNNGTVPFSIRKISLSIPVPFPCTDKYTDIGLEPDEFESIKLNEGDSKRDISLIFNIPKDHIINKSADNLTNNGFFRAGFRMLDNEPSLNESIVTIYEGGRNKYLEKYKPSVEMYDKIYDYIIESSIIKD